jgi:guanine deaminase
LFSSPDPPSLFYSCLSSLESWVDSSSDGVANWRSWDKTPTCTRTLLKELGSIAREHDAAIQTHAAETVDQVALVEELFPDEKRDVAVLRACGLLTARTILAHGCHLTTDEAQELVAAGAAVVSCPYSNMLFSRATLPVPHFRRLGLKVGLGTDIAGGWSSSVWENARLAVLQDRVDSFVRVGAHPVPADPVPPAWEVTFIYALHLATVGGARCLGLDTPAAGVGLLDVGRAFDALRIRLDAPDQRFDHRPSDPVADRFERFALTGDDRNIDAVWIAGRLVWERDAAGG